MMWLALVLILFSGIEDRLIGWGGIGRFKPVLAGLVGFSAIAYAFGMHSVGCLEFACAWLLWRCAEPMKIVSLGASINPITLPQVFGTFIRHLIGSMLFLIPAFLHSLHRVVPVFEAMLMFSFFAAFLAWLNVRVIPNAVTETTRGLVLGYCLYLGFWA